MPHGSLATAAGPSARATRSAGTQGVTLMILLRAGETGDAAAVGPPISARVAGQDGATAPDHVAGFDQGLQLRPPGQVQFGPGAELDHAQPGAPHQPLA